MTHCKQCLHPIEIKTVSLRHQTCQIYKFLWIFQPIPGVSLCGTSHIWRSRSGWLPSNSNILSSVWLLSLLGYSQNISPNIFQEVFPSQDTDHHLSPGRFLTSTLPVCPASIQCSSSQTYSVSLAGLDPALSPP